MSKQLLTRLATCLAVSAALAGCAPAPAPPPPASTQIERIAWDPAGDGSSGDRWFACSPDGGSLKITLESAANPTAFNVNSIPSGAVSNSAVLSVGGSSFSTALPSGTCFVVSGYAPLGGEFRYAAKWNQPSERLSGESNAPLPSTPFTTQSDFFRSCSVDGDAFTLDLAAGSVDVTVSITNVFANPPINHQASVSGGGSWTSPPLPVGSCWSVSIVSSTTAPGPVFSYDATW